MFTCRLLAREVSCGQSYLYIPCFTCLIFFICVAPTTRRGRRTAETTEPASVVPTTRTARSSRKQEVEAAPEVQPTRKRSKQTTKKTTEVKIENPPSSRATRSRAKKADTSVVEKTTSPAPRTTRTNGKKEETVDTSEVTRSSRSRAKKSIKCTPLLKETHIPTENIPEKKTKRKRTRTSQKVESECKETTETLRRSLRLRK